MAKNSDQPFVFPGMEIMQVKVADILLRQQEEVSKYAIEEARLKMEKAKVELETAELIRGSVLSKM